MPAVNAWATAVTTSSSSYVADKLKRLVVSLYETVIPVWVPPVIIAAAKSFISPGS